MAFHIENIFSVKDKVVVITGGGSGLGKALAEGFAQNGAKVYITEFQGMSGQRMDVPNWWNRLYRERNIKIEVLINNAGLPGSITYPAWDPNDADAVQEGLWKSLDDDSFASTNSVNISGVYFTTVGFVPLLRKSPNPSVIVIASLAAVMNQRAMGTLAYATSKAAALHLSKLLAGRFHPMKIRVNAVLPGIFPSEMTTTNKSSASASLNHFATAAAKRSTAGRAGLPEEIVGPCLMLSSKAGGYMNGGCIMVDGGRAMGGSINDGIRMPEDTYFY
ncbi:putative galactose dehydrogenase GalD [Colletotrichum siamense]|uniref:putative galactose dehydrogenase GalD n=1 Tax=Colletotrichum siamense TaxID=690259 RepID=UPI0018726A5B|nr:putative galactose dehydrogenase GalD [Colletotrichum siamense]KAF5505646.1 putative galactose dehydrogenase GalD [Colletotrichum siamense]